MSGPQTAEGVVEPPTDTQRLEWVLPILSCGPETDANARLLALGRVLFEGLDGRDAIDLAMRRCP